MSGTVRELLTWAASQVRVAEDPPGSNKQPFAALAGHANGFAWCATFLVAGWKVTGVDLLGGTDTAFTPTMHDAFKNAGRLRGRPRPGDVGFLFVEDIDRIGHAFFVNKVEGDFIRTIEGNSNRDGSPQGQIVCRNRRKWRGNELIRGFGRQRYAAASPPVVSFELALAAREHDILQGEGAVSHPREVRIIEAALLAEGLLSQRYAKDGSFGARTKAAYRQWQHRAGLPPEQRTGVLDEQSLRKLGRRHGFVVS